MVKLHAPGVPELIVNPLVSLSKVNDVSDDSTALILILTRVSVVSASVSVIVVAGNVSPLTTQAQSHFKGFRSIAMVIIRICQ